MVPRALERGAGVSTYRDEMKERKNDAGLREVAGAREWGMECRSGCGACCIAPSISSAIPGMPHGKPAGIPCVQLLPDFRCALFGRPERPAVCAGLRPTNEMCGASREEALAGLAALESVTRPRRAGRESCGGKPQSFL